MKIAGMLLAGALVCAAQLPNMAPVQTPPVQTPAAAPAPAPPPFDRVAVGTLEMGFEQRLGSLDVNDSFQVQGACTGVYVNGFGMVFTMPVVLAATPVANPFRGALTSQEKAGVHKRKLEHLPLLKKAMKEMLVTAFNGLPKLLPTDKVALGVRAFYLDWEDKSGLPAQIVVSADRASALAGNIQVDEQ
jgi:hypothetical protein